MIAIFLSVLYLATAQETTTYVSRLEPFPGPQAYKHWHSGTTFYVETDGRHVAAISGDGKLLWNRDPFKDANLPFYRTKGPKIIYIGPISKSDRAVGEEPDKFVVITFNSSQFGLLKISNGEFRWSGQD